MPDSLLGLTIQELVSRYPVALTFLASHGLEAFVADQVRSTFGAAVTLRTALVAANINPKQFARLLGETISLETAPDTSQPGTAPLNLFALLPCPLKIPLEGEFTTFLENLAPDQRDGLSWIIEGNANNQIDYADYADHFQSLDEMPDIIITPGFNSFHHPRFVKRFIDTGCFASADRDGGDARLTSLGVRDPDGHYTMLAMNLLLPVVDHARLGDRPLPRRWADLLNPVYEKSIAIRGNRVGTFCETLLLSLYKDFGDEGLHQLGRNVAWGWHPSQMVKAAGSGRDDTPAISVMPLFFANTIKNRDQISIIWPEDGVLVSPVTMLVKKERRQALAPLLDFLSGPRVAGICAGACFPTLHPEVDNGLPERTAFKWIGWDYIKSNDIKALLAHTNETFLAAYHGKQPS